MTDEAKSPEAPVQTSAPPASPTGTPYVPTKLVPYIGMLFVAATAVAGASQIPALHLPPEVFGYAMLVSIVLGGLLGVSPGLRKTVPLVLLCVALSASCAHSEPLVVTGDSIEAAGKTFEATEAVMVSLRQSRGITEDQWRTWYAFAMRFRPSLHAARLLYDAAVETDGGVPSGRQAAQNIVNDLIAELGTYAALIEQVVRPDGGAS